MKTINNATPAEKASPITNFVITLGKLLLQQKCRDWLDMDGVAQFCRHQAIQLNGHCASSTELETELRQFFKSKDEFFAESINLDGYERPKGWDRPFMIRACPYSAAQHSMCASTEKVNAVEAMGVCND